MANADLNFEHAINAARQLIQGGLRRSYILNMASRETDPRVQSVIRLMALEVEPTSIAKREARNLMTFVQHLEQEQPGLVSRALSGAQDESEAAVLLDKVATFLDGVV